VVRLTSKKTDTLRPRAAIAVLRPGLLTEVGNAEPAQLPRQGRSRSTTAVVGAAATGLASAMADAAAAQWTSPRAAVAAAEAVSTARRILYTSLIDSGWAPPPGVLEGMRLDARLVREGLGAGYDGMPGVQSGPSLVHADGSGQLTAQAGPARTARGLRPPSPQPTLGAGGR
jgi:hypothetical protein